MKNLIIKLVVLTGLSALTVKITMIVFAIALLVAIVLIIIHMSKRNKQSEITINKEAMTFTHIGSDVELTIISEEHLAFLEDRFNVTN
jgi:uncharacterized protein YoxC